MERLHFLPTWENIKVVRLFLSIWKNLIFHSNVSKMKYKLKYFKKLETDAKKLTKAEKCAISKN